ncbi:MAG: hypothetical protein JSV52_13740 [Candidatus Zixiibacteriota bacterium]|nr:MAG: hypothetical protein JSV52_13740 [candidate division Zixibacteria bacterium]
MRNVLQYIAIILGLVAPTFELVTRVCTQIFFDPLPGLIHITLFYLLPVSMLVAKLLLAQPYSLKRNRWATLCVCYALTMSTAYSIWFLPISWICALGVIFMGIGILGLAPFFLFVAALTLFAQWRAWVPEEVRARSHRKAVWATLLVLPTLVILLWHPIVISVGESMLKSPDADKRYTGLKVLKNLTSSDELLWRSFSINTRLMGTEIYDSEVLRQAYYYIHGTRPGIARNGKGFLGAGGWQFDRDQGSTDIGQRQEGLVLAESAIDAVVETSGGYGYYEWTMVFDNAAGFSREARAAVQLPQHSVVSKVSLWVDGEEREAAFGATSQVRDAYRSVVRRRKDPLLVTMIGPDQVQLQCFPVPAEGSMKIRIGVTCPLLEGIRLQIPHFIESNFDIADELAHHAWIEADADFDLSVEGTMVEGPLSAYGLSDTQIRHGATFYEFDVAPPQQYVYADGSLVLGRITSEPEGGPPVLLIDGRKDVVDKLKNIKWDNQTFSAVVFAQPFGFKIWTGEEGLGEFIADQSVYGGVNPSPALVEAVRIAGEKETSVIWLHGSLPSSVRDELALEQVLRRQDEPVTITTLAVSGDLNTMISDISYMRHFAPVPNFGDLETALAEAVKQAQSMPSAAIKGIPLGGRTGSRLIFTSDSAVPVSHPGRLYLYSRVMHQWNTGGKADDNLIREAVLARLVTPMTGAVVLENQAQYERANLDPSIGEENIPKIPEPEFYILLGLSLAVMIFYYLRRRPRPWRISL